jgi:DNA-binding NarL/FixJ family response regulator
MQNRPRILIADDHTLVADLCQRLLETEFEVAGTVSNGRAMVQAVAEMKPDVILVDIAMPILNGFDASAQAREIAPCTKVIFLTMNPDIKLAAEAFQRGASGYLLKTCASSEMVTAIREVLRGKTYISRTLCKDDVNYLLQTGERLVVEDERLTPRQREVLQLLAEGKVMKEIADILNMTTRTVAFHKYRIMDVLGATSNAELVRYAVRHHMVAA